MRVEKFLKSRSDLGKTRLTAKDLEDVNAYLMGIGGKTSMTELGDFLDDIATLSRRLDILQKAASMTDEVEVTVMARLVLIQTLQCLQENRELILDVFKFPEFEPTSS